MADYQSVKDHYDSLEDDVLLDLWSRGGQLNWAEALLRAELRSRGVPESELQRLADERETRNRELDEQLEMSQFGALGRFITLIGGGMLAGVAGSLWGWRAVHLTVAIVAFIYGSLVLKLIVHLNKTLPEGPSSFYRILRRIIELIIVFAILLFSIFRAIGKV